LDDNCSVGQQLGSELAGPAAIFSATMKNASLV
jgi:hypothetical protein